MRERLVELLNESGLICQCAENYNDVDYYVGKIADFLLANGVIVPPCKVGQTVYRIVEMSTGITSKIRAIRREAKATGAIIPCEPTIKRFIRCVTVTKNNLIDCCENYGKTVFPSREEAEQALVTDTNVGGKKEEGD